MKKISLLALSMLASAGVLMASVARAEYPIKPIEIIIPYGPGSTDSSGRILINAMKKVMDADFVPINKTGAGGTVGLATLAKAKPDGYTISYSPIAPVTVQPHLRKLSYDDKSFEPICLVSDNPTAVTVAPNSPYNSIDDMIKAAKSGEKIVAVGPAPGSMPHITQAAIANAYGVKFIYLPAGGGGKAAKAIYAGEATFAADTIALGPAQGLKTLAVSADKRAATLPDIPTFKELGKNVQVTIWFGLFAPAGTPTTVLDKLSDACSKAHQTVEYQENLKKAKFLPRFMDRTEFKKFFASEYNKNKEMLPIIGVKLNK